MTDQGRRTTGNSSTSCSGNSMSPSSPMCSIASAIASRRWTRRSGRSTRTRSSSGGRIPSSPRMSTRCRRTPTARRSPRLTACGRTMCSSRRRTTRRAPASGANCSPPPRGRAARAARSLTVMCAMSAASSRCSSPSSPTGLRPVDSAGRGLVVAHGTPIVCGGVLVHPGDIVFGDWMASSSSRRRWRRRRSSAQR